MSKNQNRLVLEVYEADFKNIRLKSNQNIYLPEQSIEFKPLERTLNLNRNTKW